MSEFENLKEIIAKLRSPQGCQWDREQTIETIKPNLIEETYEVLESIDSNDMTHLKEELGDLLCQIVFISQMASEEGKFTIEDVISGISSKLVRRHPHVFGDENTNDTKVILKNWEKIKKSEKGNEGRKSYLDGLPKHLPALLKAYRIQEKAKRVGFEWSDAYGALEKVNEELEEIKIEIDNRDMPALEEEIGDILFAIVNVGRYFKIEPENALQKTIIKFYKRFNYIETRLKEMGKSLEESNLQEMDKLWEEAKEKLSTY